MYQSITDVQLKDYIDQVFYRYDVNRNGCLSFNELHGFLNELFLMTGFGRTVTQQEAYNALLRIDANHDGCVNKFELFNLFKLFTIPNWQMVPHTAPIFMGWGGIPTRYRTTTTTTTYGPTMATSYVGGMNMGVGMNMGMPVSSGVTTYGQTMVAPPIVEKAYVQDIPAQSRMEYIPYQRSDVMYDQVERVEQVPVQRVVTEFVPVTRQEMVPVERTVQDYYAVEYQTEYVPRVVTDKVVDFVQQERVHERVHYTPIETSVMHGPTATSTVSYGGMGGMGGSMAQGMVGSTYGTTMTTSTVNYGPMSTSTYGMNTGMAQGAFYQTISDMQLKQYIDQVFVRYDTNRSGVLNLK